MKILYLHQYFKKPDENGGTRSYDLSTLFVKCGYEVEVITTSSLNEGFHDRKWRSENVHGVIVHYLYLPYDNSFSFFKRAWAFFLFLWHSSIKVLQLDGDLVLATSTPLTIGIPALVKKIFHKTPYIFEVRDVWPEAVIAIGAIKSKWMQKALYFLEKKIYENSSAIVPLSIDMKNSIVERYPQIKHTPIIVIENISEIDRFNNVSITPINLQDHIGFNPRFSILYAGTFGRVNGVNYVIELAEKTVVLDPNLVYILIGNGAEKDSIIELAKKKNIYNKNVFILNAITKDDLPSWYASVDMGSSFVIPIKELWANSANKFFDTLAAGKPILINYRGWQEDIIKNDKLGYVLSEEISNEEVNRFLEYSKNSNEQENQKVNALNKGKSSYSLEVAAVKYMKLFKSLINV